MRKLWGKKPGKKIYPSWLESESKTVEAQGRSPKRETTGRTPLGIRRAARQQPGTGRAGRLRSGATGLAGLRRRQRDTCPHCLCTARPGSPALPFLTKVLIHKLCGPNCPCCHSDERFRKSKRVTGKTAKAAQSRARQLRTDSTTHQLAHSPSWMFM